MSFKKIKTEKIVPEGIIFRDNLETQLHKKPSGEGLNAENVFSKAKSLLVYLLYNNKKSPLQVLILSFFAQLRKKWDSENGTIAGQFIFFGEIKGDNIKGLHMSTL